jgi:flagellar assembly protein FliH
LRPAPLSFAAARGEAVAMGDGGDIEARELELPSVSAEHLSAIEREAYAAGYAKGQLAAERESSRQLEMLTARLAATIEEIGALRPAAMRRAERELVQLALSMAARIVRREIDIDPDLLLVIARVAVDRLGERAAAVVHLHPADHARLAPTQAEAPNSLDLVADENVPRGGCRIESAFGEIDAGIDAQIRELSRELIGGDDDSEEFVDGVLTR